MVFKRYISKLFLRIKKQKSNPNNYQGLNIQENILFYILSSTNDSLIEERLPIIVYLISETFKLSSNEKSNLSNLYNSPPFKK